MRAQLFAGLRALIIFTLILGLAYPLLVTGIAQVTMGDKADGSLIRRDGVVIGSELIGQSFDGDEWFHSRPSAAGDGYDAMSSSASNLGPTNAELLDLVAERVEAYRSDNGLTAAQRVPVDAVTSSGSGLDPHISTANARLQAPRVARARGLRIAEVLDQVETHTDGRPFGFLGEPGVNVVELNLALETLR